MASAYKVLGQACPASSAPVDIYTVPALTSTITSTLMVCNTDSASHSFSVAVRPAGATLATLHYLYKSVILTGNNTMDLTTALTLATTDVVTVISEDGQSVAFSLFGTEQT